MTNKSHCGYYLYAITKASIIDNVPTNGISNAPVFNITEGKISAIVSECSLKRIRPERKNLMAHNNVLKALLKETTILPMALGIITETKEDILSMLSLNENAFCQQLDRVENCVEMGLRVKWDVPNIFEYFISTHPELKAARDRLIPNNREPLQDEKIEIGQLFDRLLNQDREDHSALIRNLMRNVSKEIKELLPLHDLKEISNFAFLVEKELLDDHEKAVFATANKFNNSFAFDYTGPWAPHNFVDIELKL